MGGIFGFDANKNTTKQTTVNQQATSQYGDVTGGTSDSSIGSKGAGVGAKSKLSAKGDLSVNISNTTLDAEVAKAAIAGNTSLSIAALEREQSLASLAVGFANSNATTALQTLQSLGQGQQVVAAGGSAGDVLESATGSTVSTPSRATYKILIVAVAVVAIAAIYIATKRH